VQIDHDWSSYFLFLGSRKVKTLNMMEAHIGFIGAGGIARAHAYALSAQKFYYSDSPHILLQSVTSRTAGTRQRFADQYGFQQHQDVESFAENDSIDAVFILGPNNVHKEHLALALKMPSVRRIYLEKPVCASFEEEQEIRKMLSELKRDVRVQVGFQFLQAPAIREALIYWKEGHLGKPIHFDIKYYHGDYLKKSYREKRVSRLTPAPDGGAMADLGSHAISLAVALLGDGLQVTQAQQSGSFSDVPQGSDLFCQMSLFDASTNAVGTLSASRVSAGTEDLLSFDIYAEGGAMRYSSAKPDVFEVHMEGSGEWKTQLINSRYPGLSAFPSGYLPAGWLRSMVHAHYIFLTGNDKQAFTPDLQHGLQVQRRIREAAGGMASFRRDRLMMP
jgi:predicted dehydrogenase